MSTAVYRIVTDRTVIRCWDPADAQALKRAVDASLAHLRPWLPWAAREPQSVEQKVAELRRKRASFDMDQAFGYGIMDPTEREVLGGAELDPRVGEGGLEIGYWIRAERAHRGLATEVAGALTRVGFEVHELGRMEIHCAVGNDWSAAVARKLGYGRECTLRERTPLPDGTLADREQWILFADAYPASAASRVAAQGFDAAGRRLL